LASTDFEIQPFLISESVAPRDLRSLDLTVCRARVVLSLVLLISIYVDPTIGGTFAFEGYQLLALLLHLAYSVGAYVACRYGVDARKLLPATAALDLIFASALAILTEGVTSPAYVLFVFAIIAVGCEAGIVATLTVTVCSLILYFMAIAFFTHGISDLYLMRAIYLAIVGYLIGFFSEQRARFETRLRDLESAAERHTIARELHDGFVQSLAGVNLRLHICREMLSTGQNKEALTTVTELQNAVAREYDQVRGYIQRLANIESRPMSEVPNDGAEMALVFSAELAAKTATIEQILQIVLEGIRNTRQHGKANLARIDARTCGDVIRIAIDDNGIGFPKSDRPPWTIASRVAEMGGRLTIREGQPSGTRIEIEMPSA
jgi:signal transduction histidine kinase